MTRATMARIFTMPSGAASICMAGDDDTAGAGVMAEDWDSVGAGRLTSGWVCCIFTVALGSGGLAPPSGGRVMRAVSFFGAAAFIVTGADWIPLPMGSGALGAAPLGAGAGLSGTVGRAPRAGGLGGGFTPLIGLAGGSGMPACEGGRGGGGMKGLLAEGGGGGGAAGAGAVSSSAVTILVVSFFGAPPRGGAVGAGLPGRLIRTVSRFTVVG